MQRQLTITGPRDLLLDRAVSVQFMRRIAVRFIRELTGYAHGEPGWTWVEVYQLDSHGDAIDAIGKRELFVPVRAFQRAAELGAIFDRRRAVRS